MNRTHTYLFLIVLFSFWSIFVQQGSAINTATSGRILDNFKHRQKELLFDTGAFSGTGANDMIEQEYVMHGLDSLKTRLQAIETVYQDKKEDIAGVRISLENALKKIENSIDASQKSILETQEMIRQKKIKIQELHASSVSLKVRIAKHRKIILDYLANLYSQGNLVLDDGGGVDLVKGMIMTENDTDYVLSDITYKTLVMQMGQKFVDDYRDMVRELYVLGTKIQGEEENLKSIKVALEKQKITLEGQKKEREKLLEITQGQEAKYIEYIAAQQLAQNQVAKAWQKANESYQASYQEVLKKYNCSLEEAESGTEDCAQVKQFFDNERKLAQSVFREGSVNIFDWPVKSRRITTYFRDAGYYRWLGSQHDAIDIGEKQGADIVAPADGYVYFVLEPRPGGYSYMAIKHRDGFVSVYGHLSEVIAKKYQFVRRGELIAKSGGQIGTDGAGPMTSGPHLHYELWKDKEPVDPLRYMSLAGVAYKSIPAVYQQKFIDDIVEKAGNDADLSQYKRRFVIKGDTEADRQKYLLNTYASSDFKNWEMWTDAAIASKIDPSFLMCIGLAETTLGNYLKTPYNIGNVGNTDDGSVRSFSSPQQGIGLMTQTLNNKYLGGYTRVSDLSRWGNTTGPIYASSPSNWHTNMIRCMSALKGRFVEDGYQFRIQNP